ncbi:amino acid ABC transporter permease [Leucobacter sp. UT-8R-CII-1-4]|uniref:amino acid ABC transporter permease n=1 Tax=Leucobacter sp. UT-8R-CII-1-4 TaxID=3040075 RepID=UPI0024A950C7|nr:amino acid ABC transporter permease [Leucobacter sp. UT-8R-CII-1-4]MDI6022687.1 amino acid ABC transporter permease [Leucobacter sp. UT-8R-CII-1-4]
MTQPITQVVNVAPPKPIRAVPLRHPWRNFFAVALIIGIVAFILDAAQREAYDWPSFAQYLFDERVMMGAANTLALTVLAMILAVVVGIIIAIMRETTNPVLRGIAFGFLWFFRGTPVYVQLVFWGLFTAIYQQVNVGLPFTEPWFTLELVDVIPVFWIAVVGLGLNEAAYMAEIVRAGLLSVDKGQSEAADALGMSWWLRMRKVVIPQAMRVIIPPTGNELISMLKTTSLVTAVPYNYDLYTRARDISSATLNPIPLLMVACVWYLVFTSIMMYGQSRLEKHFSKGQNALIASKRKRARRKSTQTPAIASEGASS